MNRKQKLWFIFLCLLPFITAMSFRASDNHFYQIEKKQRQKQGGTYFPKTLPDNPEQLYQEEYSCDEVSSSDPVTNGVLSN